MAVPLCLWGTLRLYHRAPQQPLCTVCNNSRNPTGQEGRIVLSGIKAKSVTQAGRKAGRQIDRQTGRQEGRQAGGQEGFMEDAGQPAGMGSLLLSRFRKWRPELRLSDCSKSLYQLSHFTSLKNVTVKKSFLIWRFLSLCKSPVQISDYMTSNLQYFLPSKNVFYFETGSHVDWLWTRFQAEGDPELLIFLPPFPE